MPTETLAYTYTSEAELIRLMGADGALAFGDDDELGTVDADIYTDIVNMATCEVDMYIQHFYTPDIAHQNLWVRRVATWIGAHLYTQRRGNPGAYESLYQTATDWLNKIRSGKFQIPRLYQRANVYPAHSNLVVDDRFPYNKLRVEQSNSTGGTTSNQDLAPVVPYGNNFS